MFKSLLPWKHAKTKVMSPEKTMDDENAPPAQKLISCKTCSRTFLPSALQKHEPICEKNATKKRKKFDSLKQRLEGTDLEQFHQKSYLKKTETTPKNIEKCCTSSKWEESHLKLVDAIRSAKGASHVMSSNKKNQLLVLPTNNERCPFCERQFGHKAFDRHVEWCREHQSRIQKSPAPNLVAKERLEARIKYRVPQVKSKRTTVKDKYSPNKSVFTRTSSVCSVKSSLNSAFIDSAGVKKLKSVADLGKNVQITPKIDKVASTNTLGVKHNIIKTSTPLSEGIASAERQFRELLEIEDFTAVQIPPHRPQTSVKIDNTNINQKKIIKSAEASCGKYRSSVIDPPVIFQDSDATLDDFEMLENMLNNQLSNENFYPNLNKEKKDNFNVNLNERKYSDDTISIDSNLINEHDNLSIPENFKLDDYSPTTSADDTDTTVRNDHVDLYSLEYDKKIDSTEKSLSKSANKNKTHPMVKQRDNKKPNSIEGLSASTERKKNVFSEFEKDVVDMGLKAEDLFPIDDNMYAEYKIYEEMYLKEKGKERNTKRHRSKNNLKSFGIKLSNDDSTTKTSDDSAYGRPHQKICMKLTEGQYVVINAIKLHVPFCDCLTAFFCTVIIMSVVPHGMLAVRKVRQNEEKIKKQPQTFFNQTQQYSPKYMNSIWGMYNRYSVHNLKKKIDPCVFTFMGQQEDIVAPVQSVEISTDFKSLTSSAQSLLTNNFM